MNGEMFTNASIVANARKALKTSTPIGFNKSDCENSIKFAFLSGGSYQAPDVSSWFEELKKREAYEIKMLCPYEVGNRIMLGFANSSANSILCFFKDGKTTCFIPEWTFNREINKWDVLYKGYAYENVISQIPKFENNTESFRKVLVDIKGLAKEIECDNFADIFDSAIKTLDGQPIPAKKCPDYLSSLPKRSLDESIPIPEANLRLFEAAFEADVFGGMGSWNDSAPYMADEKGLKKEYDNLSDELLRQLRLATMYAINEW